MKQNSYLKKGKQLFKQQGAKCQRSRRGFTE